MSVRTWTPGDWKFGDILAPAPELSEADPRRWLVIDPIAPKILYLGPLPRGEGELLLAMDPQNMVVVEHASELP